MSRSSFRCTAQRAGRDPRQLLPGRDLEGLHDTALKGQPKENFAKPGPIGKEVNGSGASSSPSETAPPSSDPSESPGANGDPSGDPSNTPPTQSPDPTGTCNEWDWQCQQTQGQQGGADQGGNQGTDGQQGGTNQGTSNGQDGGSGDNGGGATEAKSSGGEDLHDPAFRALTSRITP